MFQLETPPEYLESENGEIFSFPIDSSEFVHMNSYILDVPGKTPVKAIKSEQIIPSYKSKFIDVKIQFNI